LKCKICGRKAESEFCNLHRKAYENLLEKYDEWREAMGISWEEYLKEIIENPFTGIWVKEVAQFLMSSKKGREDSRKKS